MLTTYLIALLVGGTLIAISLLFGGDADADADADLSADADADADASHGADLDAADVWIPFASVRFWIFFSAFFGLCGTLLTTVADMSAQLVVAPISAGTGYVCGIAAVAAVRWLVRNEADSSVRTGDMVGAKGKVLLPIAKGETGKVRLELKGQVIDVLATTVDSEGYSIGALVMIYETRSDGEVLVTKADVEA